MLQKAKKFTNKNGYLAPWMRNGKIFLRKKDENEIFEFSKLQKVGTDDNHAMNQVPSSQQSSSSPMDYQQDEAV